MEKVKQVVDKVIHPKDHGSTSTTTGHHSTTGHTTGSSGLTGTHGTTGHTTGSSGLTGTHGTSTGSGLTGTHGTSTSSGLTGSHGTHNTTGVTGSSTTTAGPHNSDMMNKLDPRVDSDRDGSRNMGAAQYGPGGHTSGTHSSGLTGTHGTSTGSGLTGTHTSTGSGLTGSHGTHNTTGVTGSSTTTAGPHKSDMMNKLDPRVDSDRDGSGNMGAAQYGPGATTSSHTTGTHTGSHGTSGLTGTHVGSHNTTGLTGSSTHHAGPHSSGLANSADPRVDSDFDNSRTVGGNTGYGTSTTTSGLGHSTAGSTNPGPVHNSNLLNKLDPRVDSDADNSRNMGATQASTAGYTNQPPVQRY